MIFLTVNLKPSLTAFTEETQLIDYRLLILLIDGFVIDACMITGRFELHSFLSLRTLTQRRQKAIHATVDSLNSRRSDFHSRYGQIQNVLFAMSFLDSGTWIPSI